jgi:hypothetical protein
MCCGKSRSASRTSRKFARSRPTADLGRFAQEVATMSELNLGDPVGEALGESIGEPIGVRWQADLVPLTARCRFCDRRVHPARAIDGRFGPAHERCWEERLRAGRPHLWLVDRAGVARRSGLAPELEDGAHAALRELSQCGPVIPALRERTLAFLSIATKQGFVPALPNEVPGPYGERRTHDLLRALYHRRLSQLFELQLRLAVDIAKGGAPCES